MSGRQGVQELGNICICEKHDWWAEYIGQEGSDCPYCKQSYVEEYFELMDDQRVLKLQRKKIERELKELQTRWRKAVKILKEAGLPIPPETRRRRG